MPDLIHKIINHESHTLKEDNALQSSKSNPNDPKL